MAQPQPSLSGADRIRALKDDASVFQAFDSYPWKKDKAFMVRMPSLTLTHMHAATNSPVYSLACTQSWENQINKTPRHLSTTWPFTLAYSTTPKE